MPILEFPDPRSATSDGIVAIGGDLHPESLRLAYRKGIFPWPIPKNPLLWFSPSKRGVLFFKDFHIPKSLQKFQKKSSLSVTVDRDFAHVIQECALTPRPGQDGTWITPEVIAAYRMLHELGDAHSIEVWDGDGRLVGGLYGIEVDGTFAAESMFHKVDNASKLAILHLVNHLKKQDVDWMDIQILTPHMKALGAKEITRAKFLGLLHKSFNPTKKLF